MTTRQAKTPLQRAQERLGIEERRVKKVTARRAAAQAVVAEIDVELADARRRLAYAQADPALPDAPPLFDELADEPADGERGPKTPAAATSTPAAAGPGATSEVPA